MTDKDYIELKGQQYFDDRAPDKEILQYFITKYGRGKSGMMIKDTPEVIKRDNQAQFASNAFASLS